MTTLEQSPSPVLSDTLSAAGGEGRGEGIAPLDWTEHPLVDSYPEFRKLSESEIRELLAEGMSHDDIVAHRDAREKRIRDSNEDPFRAEFPLPHWAELEAEILRHLVVFIPGGNNPGKSRWAASYVMRVLTRQVTWPNMPPGKVKVLMIAQDDDASRMFQQDKVYAQMPREWRGTNESAKKPPRFAKCINYSDKNGFTEGNFVLPRPLQGQCWFKTVAQYIREPKSFEGPDYDLVIIDEGCPLALFKSLQGRVAKRGGKIVYLLTCLNGYDQTLGQGLEGARIVKTLPMQHTWTGNGHGEILYPELRLTDHQTDLLKRLGCPAGEMPYIMQPINPHHRVVFMWNIWNPFQPPGQWRHEPGAKSKEQSRYWGNGRMPAMMDSCVGDPRWRVLVKMFGWIERIGQLALGNFNPETHVVRGEAREALDALIKEGKACVYLGDDPETQRSHAILWLAVFAPNPAYPNGLKYVFDESPRMREGEWVSPSASRGEGQFVYRATGANWYKRYLREREAEWNLCEVGGGDALVGGQPRDGQKRDVGVAATLHPRIIARRGDPRGFATEESTATGTRNLFELYLEDHTAEHAACGPMIFQPAKIRRASTLDIDIIIGLLKYDEDRASREGGTSAGNTPQLLVSDRCENFIRCALNYTLTDLGKADEDNPYRDFIDALRYVLSSDTPYIDHTVSGVVGGGAWG